MSGAGQMANLFRDAARRYQVIYLPEKRVDRRYDSTPMKAGEAYCRLWLIDLGLARGIDWFITYYPIVHVATTFFYGKGTITVPYLAAPLQQLAAQSGSDNLERVIQERYALTPRFPFNQGLIELEIGLFKMQASNPILKFMETLGRFSKFLPTGQISSFSGAVDISKAIYQGIEDLIGAGSGQLELGYQTTLSDPIDKVGYFAVILAEEQELDKTNLYVQENRLRVGWPPQPNSQPLKGYSYMLFQLERYSQQDWEDLISIKDLVYEAQDKVFNGNYSKVKICILPKLRSIVFSSPDIAKNDRRGMIVKIETHLREIGLQAASTPKLSFYEIMQRPLPEKIDPQLEAELAILEKNSGVDSV